MTGIGLGLLIKAKLESLTTTQALVLIWSMATILGGALIYAYVRWKSWLYDKRWIIDKGDLFLFLGVIAVYALLVTGGWYFGSNQYDTSLVPAGFEVNGSPVLAGIAAILLFIVLAAALPWVGIPLLFVLLLGMLAEALSKF